MTESSTTILRRLLDERGVEWWEATPCKTKWNSPIIGGPVAAREWNGEMVLDTGYIAVTPEQAIAATLGHHNAGRYVGLRQGEYWERTENSDYYCGGCGWKVTDHDSYCPECGGALHEYALGAGTCHIDVRNGDWYCDACGEMVGTCDPASELFIDGNAIDMWKYCPFCGRRIEQ